MDNKTWIYSADSQTVVDEKANIIVDVFGFKEERDEIGRLIAVAPEMLEALKNCLEFKGAPSEVNWVGIEKLIAKAEGRTP